MQICILRRTALHIPLHVLQTVWTENIILWDFNSAALVGQKWFRSWRHVEVWIYSSTHSLLLRYDGSKLLLLYHLASLVTASTELWQLCHFSCTCRWLTWGSPGFEYLLGGGFRKPGSECTGYKDISVCLSRRTYCYCTNTAVALDRFVNAQVPLSDRALSESSLNCVCGLRGVARRGSAFYGCHTNFHEGHYPTQHSESDVPSSPRIPAMSLPSFILNFNSWFQVNEQLKVSVFGAQI